MEMVINSTGFVNWLKKYEEKECPRKDLYEDIRRDKGFPYGESYGAVLKHLVGMHACSECINTFKRAWKSYLKQYGNRLG